VEGWVRNRGRSPTGAVAHLFFAAVITFATTIDVPPMERPRMGPWWDRASASDVGIDGLAGGRRLQVRR